MLRGVRERDGDVLEMGEVALIVGAEFEGARSVGGDIGEGPFDEEKGGDDAVDGERREFEGSAGLGDADAPAVGEIAGDGLAAAECEGRDVERGNGDIGIEVRDELPAGTETLSVKGEGPAFGVGQAFVLVTGDVAFGREAEVEQLSADVLAIVHAVVFGESGPEEGLGEPVCAEGGAEENAGVMEKKEFVEECHMAFGAGHGEAREEGWRFRDDARGGRVGFGRGERGGGKDEGNGNRITSSHHGVIITKRRSENNQDLAN